MSALVLGDDPEAATQIQNLAASDSHSAAAVLDVPWLLNWTYSDFYRKSHHGSENSWREVNNMSSSSLDSRVQQTSQRLPVLSSFQPVVSLIPALFAKSHCMINPLIYQIMNRDFRDAVHELVFGQEMMERRQIKRREDSLFESKEAAWISLHGMKNICGGFVKFKCLFFFFASSRERQHRLLPGMEGKEGQALIPVGRLQTFQSEEPEEAVLHRKQRLLEEQQARGHWCTGHCGHSEER